MPIYLQTKTHIVGFICLVIIVNCLKVYLNIYWAKESLFTLVFFQIYPLPD